VFGFAERTRRNLLALVVDGSVVVAMGAADFRPGLMGRVVCLLQLVVEELGRAKEQFFNVLARLGRRLAKVLDVVLALEIQSCFLRDFSLRLEVLLVAHEEDHHVGVALLVDFVKPRTQVIERLPIIDRVAKDHCVGGSVEDFGDRTERLLAGGVPDL